MLTRSFKVGSQLRESGKIERNARRKTRLTRDGVERDEGLGELLIDGVKMSEEMEMRLIRDSFSLFAHEIGRREGVSDAFSLAAQLGGLDIGDELQGGVESGPAFLDEQGQAVHFELHLLADLHAAGADVLREVGEVADGAVDGLQQRPQQLALLAGPLVAVPGVGLAAARAVEADEGAEAGAAVLGAHQLQLLAGVQLAGALHVGLPLVLGAPAHVELLVAGRAHGHFAAGAVQLEGVAAVHAPQAILGSPPGRRHGQHRLQPSVPVALLHALVRRARRAAAHRRRQLFLCRVALQRSARQADVAAAVVYVITTVFTRCVALPANGVPARQQHWCPRSIRHVAVAAAPH